MSFPKETVKYPIFGSCWVTEDKFVVAGGGGSSKCGVPNAMNVFKYDFADKSMMNLSTFSTDSMFVANIDCHNGKIFGGKNTNCEILKLNGNVLSESSNFEVDSNPESIQRCIRYSTQLNEYISPREDGTIISWTEKGDKKSIFSGHSGIVNEISLCGKFMASVSEDKTCRIWNLKTKKEIQKIESTNGLIGAFRSVRITDDGETLYTVQVFRKLRKTYSIVAKWELVDGEYKIVTTYQSRSQLGSITVSPDLVAVGSGAGEVIILSLSLRQRKHFNHHTFPVTGLRFSPNNQALLSVAADNTVVVTDAVDIALNDSSALTFFMFLLAFFIIVFAFIVHNYEFIQIAYDRPPSGEAPGPWQTQP
eukprot:TRINITY_DN42_c9_g1_i1.p1 TRINITY_DN42_c9_g1~~TRINITY_DN42_c9_g1_i1.p1  ORF type:complete len:364 (-),score=92.64 TRINITY_DN42_c9_g1_i1:152-1243(-)